MHKIMILDTETANHDGDVYDVGFVIADRTGKIHAEYNALVREVFTDGERMMGAFYAKKIFSHYAPMLNDGTIKLEAWETVAAAVRSAAAEWGVKTVAAYNLGFDERVLRGMGHKFGTAPLFAEGTRELDLWQFACEVRLNKATYRKIALAQGWVSAKGNIKTGAEFAHRFLSRDFGFIEDHTALSDARIEAAIMAECFRTKKKIPYNVSNAMPWRMVQRKAA
jgi:hypothetical protein